MSRTLQIFKCRAPQLLGLVIGFAALAQGKPATAAEHMLVLIDRSGSMQETSVAGAPRWDVARQLAADTVNAAAADREFAVWVFSGTSYTEIVGFDAHMAQADVANVIMTGLGSPTSSTPLAGSICDAIDELIAYKPSEFHDKRVELFSDGLENSTPSSHPCWGPASADHGNPDVGSWEWKVFNKARTGNPNSAADPPLDLIVNADYLFEHETPVFSTFAAVVASRTAITKPREQYPTSPLIRSLRKEGVIIPDAVARAPSLEVAESINFYQKLSSLSDGRYRQFTSDSRIPQLGDVTGDYCVNDYDINAVTTQWGSTVAAGSLVDPNQDRKIDIYDYMTVLQNYGEGCNTKR